METARRLLPLSVILCLVFAAIAQTKPSATQPGESQGIAFLSVDGAGPGRNASVTVQADPYTTCSILYVTPSGRASRAKGLEDKTSGKDGKVSWTWLIGARTKPGAGSVIVRCGGKSATTQISIG
jgi:hypothetical protein